jgi:hypothetical protein
MMTFNERIIAHTLTPVAGVGHHLVCMPLGLVVSGSGYSPSGAGAGTDTGAGRDSVASHLNIARSCCAGEMAAAAVVVIVAAVSGRAMQGVEDNARIWTGR